MSRNLISRFRASLLASAMTAAALSLTPVIDGALAPAQAQVTISAEFRTALEPHGRFQRHSRYGEVWIPANRTRDWRPYTVGRWVYTEEWGWYWIEDQPEASWGTVAFHYGRWVYDDELRWVWVAGDEWGPGWVQWRQGRGERRDYIGWAPMAPDDVVVAEYQEKPEVWVFVRGRNFTAPRISAVVVPQREATVILRETVIVNRTVVVRDRFAVNPGIAPAIIAVAVGRPIRAYEVRPRVLAGTVQLPNAVVIRANDLRNPRTTARIEVRETRTEIRASAQVADPQPLGANERGRLGDTPPRAAQTGTGQTPATGTGQTPAAGTGQTPAAGTSPTSPSAGQQQGQDAAKQQQGQDAAKQQQGQDATKQQGQDAAKQQGQDAAKQQSPSQQKQDSARDAGQQKQDAAKQKQDAAKQKQDAAKKQRDDASAAAKQKQDDAREAAKQKSDAAKQKQDSARDAAKQKQPSGPSDAKQKQDPKADEPRTGQSQQPKQEGKGSEGQQKQSAPSQPQNRTEGQGKGQGAPKGKQDEPKAKQDQPQGKSDETPPTRPGAPQ
jgi:hypothetical protein